MTRNMPTAVRDHALQIAHHEMSHYVVARTLGFATGGVSLSVTMDLRHQGSASITLARSISSIDAMKAHLEARMMVLMAGAMGQTLSSGKCVDKLKAVTILKGASGAEQDYAKLKELQQLLRNLSYPDTDPAASDRVTAELKAMTDHLWDRTQTVIEERTATIAELALMLVDRMVIVEQWGRVADTYEAVLTGETLDLHYARRFSRPDR
ncbi:peptidase M41 [Pseudomonas sp. 14P_8.1_Bac3]|uniref:peptidase M41 n=1 Tax=Pseudomonas sp. 14P_8.1_Bac3 TaxID=2971621 RepID=UPI0021C5D50B|nr:peptidase M41 [Pseudomonas sp. 14P_8.1_Bac3]MCU1761749.1 peptidase M41 [Pseudomonas sp. 14P_8.1_Bac3]